MLNKIIFIVFACFVLLQGRAEADNDTKADSLKKELAKQLGYDQKMEVIKRLVRFYGSRNMDSLYQYAVQGKSWPEQTTIPIHGWFLCFR